MKNELIKSVDLQDLRQIDEENKIDYVDKDFVIASRMENLPYTNEVIRLNFFLVVICVKGKLQLDINGKTHLLEEENALLCLPTVIVSNTLFSPNHEVRMIGFSTQFLQNTLKKEKDTEKTLSYIYKNPIYTTIKEKHYPHLHHYGELILEKIKEPPHRYQKDILNYLLSAFFHEILTEIYRYTEENQDADVGLNRPGYLFRRFMMEVSKDGGIHRTVSYYADRLCYSPKYISTIVKQVSGRTALDWINECAIEQIKHHLKHSDKSIKEIAEEFGFPNQSFFGKYVRAHLGVSPLRYRNMQEG